MLPAACGAPGAPSRCRQSSPPDWTRAPGIVWFPEAQIIMKSWTKFHSRNRFINNKIESSQKSEGKIESSQKFEGKIESSQKSEGSDNDLIFYTTTYQFNQQIFCFYHFLLLLLCRLLTVERANRRLSFIWVGVLDKGAACSESMNWFNNGKNENFLYFIF